MERYVLIAISMMKMDLAICRYNMPGNARLVWDIKMLDKCEFEGIAGGVSWMHESKNIGRGLS
jgi:hypothetical protein